MRMLLGFISLIRPLPGLHGLKRSLFQAAMRLGLKQVDWLKSDNFLARYRRRAIYKIFSDAKHQRLKLLFPGQDVAFVFNTVWLSAQKTILVIMISDPFFYPRPLRY